MCSGSDAGSYLRLIDFVYHSNLGLREIKEKEEVEWSPSISDLKRARVHKMGAPTYIDTHIQGYLAHKKQRPP